MSRKFIHGFILMIFAVCSFMVAGCGYSLYGRADLPFDEISIGKIENLSLEPKLQDRLHRALVQEFAKHGIHVVSTAPNVLSGVVRKFEMMSLSERKDISVEYRINVEADFSYKDNTGKIRELKKIASPFIVSSSGSQNMSTLIGMRDMASDKAVSDIAMEIVGALIY